MNNMTIVKTIKKGKVKRPHASKLGVIIRIALLIAALTVGVILSTSLRVSNFTYHSKSIPTRFNGHNILLVSNVANDVDRVYKKILKEEPDVLVFAGGYVSDEGDYGESVKLINELSAKFNTFYVLGENDLLYGTNITSSISMANHLNGTNAIIASNLSMEDDLDKYLGKQLIERANNGDKEALSYIEYITKYDQSIIEIGGMDYSDNSASIKDDVFNIFSNEEGNYKIVVYPDSGRVGDLISTDANMILTSKSVGHGRLSSSDFLHGKAIFRVTGVAPVNSDKLFNNPEIISINITNKEKGNFVKRLLRLGGNNLDIQSDAGFIEFLANN